ncbi:MAG: hypothetical protein A3F17_02275 [Gammaproteobacteria bacterium RIFCSPHIGHO2_12_FULL_41_15]|nr:MAG: hypothetical protein A3F17_02275 [Gammaproteobacteria bacterium RIFCSPHIGHO2_12_FULL_41_15]
MTHLGLRIVMIAVGCALGGVCRFLLGYIVQQQWGSDFPYATLSINLIGSLLIGLAFALLTKQGIEHPLLNGLLITGFLGGFTTFSSFSLETVELMQSAALVKAGLYVTLSCLGCFGLSFIGLKLAQIFMRMF